MQPQLLKRTFHNSPMPGDDTVVVYVGHNRKSETYANHVIASQICMRLAEDYANFVFNTSFIRALNRKADILNVYEIFKSFSRDIRRLVGKEMDYIDSKFCEIADNITPYIDALNKAYFTETVRLFPIEQAQPAADIFTLKTVVSCVDRLFHEKTNVHSKPALDIIDILSALQKRMNLTPLNKQWSVREEFIRQHTENLRQQAIKQASELTL